MIISSFISALYRSFFLLIALQFKSLSYFGELSLSEHQGHVPMMESGNSLIVMALGVRGIILRTLQ